MSRRPATVASAAAAAPQGRPNVPPQPVPPADPGRLLAEATSCHREGRLAEAEAIYRRLLADDPRQPDALNLLGALACQTGNHAAAVELIGKAVAARPDHAEAHNNLGYALMGQGRLAPAAAAFRRALALRPGFVEVYNNLGAALIRLDRPAEAEAAYREGLARAPENADLHNNLGIALRLQDKLAEAAAAHRAAVGRRPGFAEAHNNLGVALKLAGRPTAAIAAYRKALALRPDFAEAQNNLGNALMLQGRARAAARAFAKACALRPDKPEWLSNLMLGMIYDPARTPAEMLAEGRRWDAVHGAAARVRIRPHANRREPDRRLRLGYVSPDFREHSVSRFLEPLLAAHDRGSVEVFCYAEVARPDAVTARLRALADAWRTTVGLSTAAVTEQVRQDEIDILVDLAGHTARNRLPVFAERPAPVQVSWLGFPGTTGLAAIDYRLTDALADPEGAADREHSETLVRLAGGFLCYGPPADAPAPGPPPMAAGGHVTFASFNALAKMTPLVVETWAAILAAVPGSRLLLKSQALADPGTRRRTESMFARAGIATGRIELISWLPDPADHLAAYGQADIALDPFPFNGTTTTFEALWMGLPVIGLAGDRHAGRVGHAILDRLGLDELAAPDREAYVAAAVALAGDPDRVARLRATLRARLRTSPLCDAAAFAREVEASYRAMWRRWCTDAPPAPMTANV